MLRVHRIPFSTNVERIALAAAFKGVEVVWVDHDPRDRSAIEALSGQPLFPVLELADGTTVADSTRILRVIEDTWPDPPLWPGAPGSRAGAEADVLVEWFNGVWKGPPNRIAGDTALPGDPAWLVASLDVFEGLLEDRDFLLGGFGIADVIAWPFLRYARGLDDPADADPFHAVLVAHLSLARHPRVAAWIERIGILRRSWDAL